MTVRLLVFSLLTKMSPVSLAAAGPAKASSSTAATATRPTDWGATSAGRFMRSRDLRRQRRRRHRAEAHGLRLRQQRIHVDLRGSRFGRGVAVERGLGRSRLVPAFRVALGVAVRRLILPVEVAGEA